MPADTLYRIEPTALESVSPALADLVGELSAKAAILGARLHPRSAAALAALVRIMNAYYSNLLEGHDTRPRDIERALEGDLDADLPRRDLQLEAAAHVRVQAWVDDLASVGALPEPCSVGFVRELHRRFYEHAPASALTIAGRTEGLVMEPGVWRTRGEHDVSVGRHVPPASERVDAFMNRFAERYELGATRPGTRLLALPAAHHRFNYIHPFPDGNGRVSRLMSHAMAHRTGIGAHGLWSISRGLALGLESRGDYRTWMDRADAPRQGDLDGRGNLSERALAGFSEWFVRVCLDQVDFMNELFDLDRLGDRLERHVDSSEELAAESTSLLREGLVRGEFERGEAPRLTGLPERSARRVLGRLIDAGMLASDSPKGAVSLRFPASALETLFPKLHPRS